MSKYLLRLDSIAEIELIDASIQDRLHRVEYTLKSAKTKFNIALHNAEIKTLQELSKRILPLQLRALDDEAKNNP